MKIVDVAFQTRLDEVCYITQTCASYCVKNPYALDKESVPSEKDVLAWYNKCVVEINEMLKEKNPCFLVNVWLSKDKHGYVFGLLNHLDTMILDLKVRNKPIPSTFSLMYNILIDYSLFYLSRTALTKTPRELLLMNTDMYMTKVAKLELINCHIVSMWHLFMLENEAYMQSTVLRKGW